MERLAKNKHTSLLRTLVNYGSEKFYNIGNQRRKKNFFGVNLLLVCKLDRFIIVHYFPLCTQNGVAYKKGLNLIQKVLNDGLFGKILSSFLSIITADYTT